MLEFKGQRSLSAVSCVHLSSSPVREYDILWFGGEGKLVCTNLHTGFSPMPLVSFFFASFRHPPPSTYPPPSHIFCTVCSVQKRLSTPHSEWLTSHTRAKSSIGSLALNGAVACACLMGMYRRGGEMCGARGGRHVLVASSVSHQHRQRTA